MTKPQKSSPNSLPALLVCLSIIGLVFIYFLLLQSNKQQVNSIVDRNLIGLLFSALCISGIFVAFYPKTCEKTFISREKENFNKKHENTPVLKKHIIGHHPDCGEFSRNRIKFSENILCASCTGLIVGSVFALFGTAWYFLAGNTIAIADLRILVVGEFGMIIGLFQIVFSGHVKLVVNALFVVSSFLVLVVADVVGKSIVIDLYVLGVIVLILIARIILSQWNNKRVCINCGNCEFLKEI